MRKSDRKWLQSEEVMGRPHEKAWIAGGNLKDREPESSGGFFTQVWHLCEEGSKAGLNRSYELENLCGVSPAWCPPGSWTPYMWLRAPRSSFPANKLHGVLCSSIKDHFVSLPLSSIVYSLKNLPQSDGRGTDLIAEWVKECEAMFSKLTELQVFVLL